VNDIRSIPTWARKRVPTPLEVVLFSSGGGKHRGIRAPSPPDTYSNVRKPKVPLEIGLQHPFTSSPNCPSMWVEGQSGRGQTRPTTQRFHRSGNFRDQSRSVIGVRHRLDRHLGGTVIFRQFSSAFTTDSVLATPRSMPTAAPRMKTDPPVGGRCQFPLDDRQPNNPLKAYSNPLMPLQAVLSPGCEPLVSGPLLNETNAPRRSPRPLSGHHQQLRGHLSAA